MKLFKVITSIVQTNTYIIYNHKDTVVVDPGGDFGIILDGLEKHGLACRYVLITHAHFDHVGAASDLQKAGAQIIMPKADYPYYKNNSFKFSNLSGEKFVPDIFAEGRQKLDLCGMEFEVISTPGHTPGSVCYVFEDCIFTGDTLFNMDIGRTDLPGGNERELIESITQRLFALDGNYTIYPGHGEPSTLEHERKNNPYV